MDESWSVRGKGIFQDLTKIDIDATCFSRFHCIVTLQRGRKCMVCEFHGGEKTENRFSGQYPDMIAFRAFREEMEAYSALPSRAVCATFRSGAGHGGFRFSSIAWGEHGESVQRENNSGKNSIYTIVLPPYCALRNACASSRMC
jgi:hypothetical protein